jgi:hypothetical protein
MYQLELDVAKAAHQKEAEDLHAEYSKKHIEMQQSHSEALISLEEKLTQQHQDAIVVIDCKTRLILQDHHEKVLNKNKELGTVKNELTELNEHMQMMHKSHKSALESIRAEHNVEAQVHDLINELTFKRG